MKPSCTSTLASLAGCLLSSISSVEAASGAGCNAGKLPAIKLPGIEILSVTASEQRGFNTWGALAVLPVAPQTPVDFCNVTVTYQHPGINDKINVYVWLPLDAKSWNGRLLAEGGGGWYAGVDSVLAQGVALGYATTNTDAGLAFYDGPAGALTADRRLFPAEGVIDYNKLHSFASTAYDDLPKIAKQIVRGVFGKDPNHSYWQGCSTGGRQGLISAQRYPDNYDGILSIAPAINWATFLVAEQWPQIALRRAGVVPSQCELAAIRKAAQDACDELDGVKDGVIAAPGLCDFDATKAVGSPFECGDVKGKISSGAATAANLIWRGPQREGEVGWFGSLHDMAFGQDGSPFGGLANTLCDPKGQKCQPWPFPISEDWIKSFLAKDQDYDVKTMSEDDFWRFLRKSRREFESIMSSNDPDVREFKGKGGKIVLWHGLSDTVIFPNGTRNYYERVLAVDPDARSHFRYFEAPGVEHCAGGDGALPVAALESLVNWVEKGVAPEKIDADIQATATTGFAGHERILCPHPLVAAYKGGNSAKRESYACAESFDQYKDQWGAHTEL